MDLEEFDDADGLKRFLEVLRASPLQQLPIPNSFSKWHSLRKADKEIIAEVIIREEELFTELQQCLTRARGTKEESNLELPRPLLKDLGIPLIYTGWESTWFLSEINFEGASSETGNGGLPFCEDALLELPIVGYTSMSRNVGARENHATLEKTSLPGPLQLLQGMCPIAG